MFSFFGQFSDRGYELYNYRARNYLKMSSKMYKFVPVLGGGGKKQEVYAEGYAVPHILANY